MPTFTAFTFGISLAILYFLFFLIIFPHADPVPVGRFSNVFKAFVSVLITDTVTTVCKENLKNSFFQLFEPLRSQNQQGSPVGVRAVETESPGGQQQQQRAADAKGAAQQRGERGGHPDTGEGDTSPPLAGQAEGAGVGPGQQRRLF